MFVKPASGRKVRWPNSMRSLSDLGEDVPDTFYWQRRIQKGDVIPVTQTAIETKKASVSVVKKEEKDG